MNINHTTIIDHLRLAGVGYYEAQIYLELLKGPSSHLKLAQATGINRTKVYRLIEELEKQSLVTRQTDDRGTFLVAADPKTLEIALVNAEEQLKQKREALDSLLPTLESLKRSGGHDFTVNTYESTEGFKQMLWHELKTRDEALVFGAGSIQDLVDDVRWAERHRDRSVTANYVIREIINPGGKSDTFTSNQAFLNNYSKRLIDPTILRLDQQTVVYNHTVATYHWRKQQKVGVEIISKTHAEMMRQVFECFWALAN